MAHHNSRFSLIFSAACTAAVAIYFPISLSAFEVLEDHSPLSDAADYNDDTYIFANANSVLVDGQVTSYPPAQKTFDRSLISVLRVGTNLKFSDRFGLRLTLDTRYTIHKIHEEEEPRRIVSEEWPEARPSVDLMFKTPGGIELFAGAKYWYIHEFKRDTESVSFSETSDYENAGLFIWNVGLLKRTHVFTGGAFYQAGKEDKRGITKTASDGSVVTTEQIVYSPLEYGIFARFDLSGYITDFEFVAVQASEGGPKAGEEGTTNIYEDYLRGRLGVLIPLDKNTLNMHVGLAHKTLSYSDNAFMSLDTIPMSAAHIKFMMGKPNKHAYVGLIYAYAEDTQSLPEFNQKFQINAYGAKLGLNYQL